MYADIKIADSMTSYFYSCTGPRMSITMERSGMDAKTIDLYMLVEEDEQMPLIYKLKVAQ